MSPEDKPILKQLERLTFPTVVQEQVAAKLYSQPLAKRTISRHKGENPPCTLGVFSLLKSAPFSSSISELGSSTLRRLARGATFRDEHVA
jgi:hypothetical protein